MTSKKHPLMKKAGLVQLTTCAIGCLTMPILSNAQEAAPPSVPVTEPSSPSDWLQWGAVSAHPYAGYTVLYDNNIDLSGTNKIDDVIVHLTPGITLHAGDTANRQERYLLVDYSADPTFFIQEGGHRNAVDHRGNLSLLWPVSRLTLGLSQDYVAITEPSVDVHRRIQQTTYNTRLTSRYQVSDKSAIEVNGRYVNRDYNDPSFVKSQEFSNDDWFDYQVTPKLSTALGVALGWVDIRNNPDQNYQRGLVRAKYEVTEKLDAHGQAGVENRQFQSGRSDRLGPVFGLGAVYQILPRTVLSLDVNREENNSSVLAGLNYVATSLTAAIRQELSEDIFLNVAGGYVNSDYRGAAPTINSTRNDDYFFVRPSLDAMLGEHWKTGIFLQYRENKSNVKNVEFDNFQAGMQASYTF
jgi:hypothetical protein